MIRMKTGARLRLTGALREERNVLASVSRFLVWGPRCVVRTHPIASMVIVQNLLCFLSILYWCNFTISGTLSPHEHLTGALLAPHGRDDFKTGTELRESQARTELEHGRRAARIVIVIGIDVHIGVIDTRVQCSHVRLQEHIGGRRRVLDVAAATASDEIEPNEVPHKVMDRARTASVRVRTKAASRRRTR